MSEHDGIVTRTEFEISASPEAAWKALEEVRIGRCDANRPDDWWIPGFESVATGIDSEVGARLTARKVDPPCEDTVIAITFEHTSSGARVTVTQSGFDQAFVDFAGPAFWAHAEHIFADLHLFLETGVIAGRAWRPWTPLGLRTTAVPYGLQVTGVAPGTWADRVGLADGDVLLAAHGAPVFTAGDLSVVERIARTGDDVEVAFVRDGSPRAATAAL